MSRAEVVSRLERAGVVPVVRTGSAARAELAVEWLAEAGFRVFEITLTTPGALEVIERLSVRGDALVGAGTVLNATDAAACIDAGARFIVSPGLVPAIPPVCAARDVACMPGALTPTEVLRAMETGADAVKVFPVASLGGVAYLKSLRALLPGTRLMPTGGIGVEEVAAYLAAGASCVGVGGRLVDDRALQAGERDIVSAAAATALQQVRDAREGAP